MKLSDWRPDKPKSFEIPRVSPAESMTGPDVINGTIREIRIGDFGAWYKVILWDCPMQREIHVHDEAHQKLLLEAKRDNKSLSCTTQKRKGKWVLTEVKEL